MINPIKASLVILLATLGAQRAMPAEQFSPDMSFLEYLGSMVEDQGKLIDPMDIDPFVSETQLEAGVGTQSQHLGHQAHQGLEESAASGDSDTLTKEVLQQ